MNRSALRFPVSNGYSGSERRVRMGFARAADRFDRTSRCRITHFVVVAGTGACRLSDLASESVG
jgi:hypothetical protein